MNPNYIYLYNNLSPEIKKYTNIYRSLSPIVIKNFGGNNFIYERKYKKKPINEIYNSEYDYFENELKKSKDIKRHTAFTELSTQENMSLFSSEMQKPTKRYYKNRTNIIPGGEYCLYLGNDNSLLKEINDNKTRTFIDDNKKYGYKIFKKEETNEIFYPNENLQNNSSYKTYKKKKNQTGFISQSFSTSIIPENKLLNKDNRKDVLEINYIKGKKSFPNKEIDLKILNNCYNNIKRDSSFTKSKINLDRFNIDKLKEIGDNFEMRLSKNENNIKQNNSEKNNLNIVNDCIKQNDLIKNMIIIKEKRKNSNNSENFLLKSNDDKDYKKLNEFEYKNKIKTPNKINKINLNIKRNKNNKKIKIINIDKNNIDDLKIDVPPKTIIIKLKHKIMGNEHDYYPNNSENKGRKILYYHNINNINKIRNTNKKILKDKTFNNSPTIRKIIQKTPDKKKVKNSKTENNSNYKNNKIININETNKKIELNNINHSYLESIDINKKNNKKTKTKHSFKDIFLPSQ